MLFEAIRGEVSFETFILFAISALIVIFLATPIHEMSHAFAADKLGDRTARYMGRLKFNPLVHIDYIGALFIIVFGFGWAKPVPVNMQNFKKPKRDMALTALAGPVSNLLVALVAMILYYFCVMVLPYSQVAVWLSAVLFYVVLIDINLAIFNFIPVPPLDGSRILNAVLPDRIYYKLMQYERYFFIILALLLYTGILSMPLDFITSKVFEGISYVAYLPFELFIG